MDLDLLDILVCPACKGRLRYDSEKEELICRFDHVAYPIRDDVPVMIFDEARSVEK